MLLSRCQLTIDELYNYATRLPLHSDEISDLSMAYGAYLQAKLDYLSLDTMHNITNLVGTHARLNKLVTDYDDEHGMRR